MTEQAKWIGAHVEIPVHYDAWMQGARSGVVIGYREGKPGLSACLLIKLDHPSIKRRLRVWRLDWEYMRVL